MTAITNPPDDFLRFWRGLAIGMPISLALWMVIAAAAWRCFH